MCTETRPATVTTVLAMVGAAGWWLLVQLARLTQLLAVALIAALIWATPRVWRTALATVDRIEGAVHAAQRRGDATVLEELPAPPTRPAVTDHDTDGVRWSTLTRSERVR